MPIKILISLSLWALAAHSQAQVYKCVENGSTTYSDKSCRHGSNPSGAPIRADGYSVVPSTNDPGGVSQNRNYTNPYFSGSSGSSGGSDSSSRSDRLTDQGRAFSKSHANPNGRPTISRLLPHGGSIDDRDKRSTQR